MKKLITFRKESSNFAIPTVSAQSGSLLNHCQKPLAARAGEGGQHHPVDGPWGREQHRVLGQRGASFISGGEQAGHAVFLKIEDQILRRKM